jgi:hypothetical protein
MRSLLLASLSGISLLFCQLALAEPLFHEAFDDGSIYDGNPVEWVPTVYTNGTYNIFGDDLQLRANVVGQPLVLVASQPQLADVSIRTRLRVEGNSFGRSVFARFTEGVATYQAGIDTSGGAYIGWNDSDTNFHLLASTQTDLYPNQEDIMLQFDAFDSQLSLFLWRPGDAKPVESTVRTMSNVISQPGHVGLLNHLRTDGNTTFRFVRVADTSIADPTLTCDFNSDAACDADDVDLMTRAGDLSSGVEVTLENMRFDLNRDLVISLPDVQVWLASAAVENGFAESYVMGDGNLDGVVEFSDFVDHNNWHATHLNNGMSVAWSSGDFDGNGIVEFPDFVVQNNNWQHAIASAVAVAVPEPSAILLITFSVIVVGRRWTGRPLPRSRSQIIAKSDNANAVGMILWR